MFNAKNKFVKDTALKMNEIFSTNNNNMNNFENKPNPRKSIKTDKKGMVNVSGIILAGNGPLKSSLYQSPFLKHYISAAIITEPVNISYGGKFGFNETIRKCAALLQQNEFEKENELIEDIMNLMNDNGDIVSIGFKETLHAIHMDMVKTLILSTQCYKYAIQLITNDEKIKDIQFATNDIELQEISKRMLERNNANNSDRIETKGFLRYFDELCAEKNIELQLVGIHSPITQQFAKGLQGCVAILHFPINIKQNEDDDDDDEWFEE